MKDFDMSLPNMEQTEIIKAVESKINGRVANKIGDRRTNNLDILLECVERAGDGNYIEIGTLFGGSAISVALLKKWLSQEGLIFCVDPLNSMLEKCSF